MDAVAAADGGGVAVLFGASAKRGKQPVDPVEEQVACPCHLDGERGVQNIGRRHALMDETRLLADMLRKAGQKGDDVMLCFAFDLVDAVDVETAPFPDCPGSVLRDHPQFGHRVAGMRLDFEPDLELGLFGPDRGHLGTRISGNHLGVFLCHWRGCGCSIGGCKKPVCEVPRNESVAAAK